MEVFLEDFQYYINIIEIDMKKIILLLIVITSMISCTDYNPDGSYIKCKNINVNFRIVEIDSCEYIRSHYRLAHKGNCKYCAERRKQELKELIKELKKK